MNIEEIRNLIPHSSEYIKSHENELRLKIEEVARKWVGGSYHINGMIPYTHSDCHTILMMIYAEAQLIPLLTPQYYNAQFMLHTGDTKYFDTIKEYASETSYPQKGDLILYRYGRVISHSAIILNYPEIIHSQVNNGTILDDATNPALVKRQEHIYSFWT